MTAAKHPSKSIIDIVPWSSGLGFEDADLWWDYVLSQPEQDRLDLLMAVALLSEDVALLLLKHDGDLLARFELTEQTIALLSEIEAITLKEFALAMILKRT